MYADGCVLVHVQAELSWERRFQAQGGTASYFISSGHERASDVLQAGVWRLCVREASRVQEASQGAHHPVRVRWLPLLPQGWGFQHPAASPFMPLLEQAPCYARLSDPFRLGMCCNQGHAVFRHHLGSLWIAMRFTVMQVREACSLLDLDVLFYPCPKDGPNFRPKVGALTTMTPLKLPVYVAHFLCLHASGEVRGHIVAARMACSEAETCMHAGEGDERQGPVPIPGGPQQRQADAGV